METEYKFDYGKIPVGQEFNVRLMVKLASSEKVTKKKPQLNLALVLDRSGSMSGQKLAFVKAATENLINRIKPDDFVSLVSFDDRVTSLIEAMTGKDARNNISIIRSIQEGGSTNLAGGYELGFRLSQLKQDKENISRIILLTDGLANVGETNKDRLSSLSRKYLSNGVSTSTIGVGSDYDEELLGQMATAGSGNSYYISRPADSESVFAEELGYLLDITEKNIVLSFEPMMKGLKIGQMNSYNEVEAGSYEIGDMYKGISRDIILEILIPAIQSQQKIQIGRIKVKYDDIADGITAAEKEIDVFIEVVSGDEFAGIVPDRVVTKKVIQLIIAQAKERVLECARFSDYDKASQIILETIGIVRSFKFEDQDIENELQELKDRADNIRRYGEEYFSSSLKKQMFYERDVILYSKSYMDKGVKSRKQHDDLRYYDHFLVIDALTNGIQKNKHEPLGADTWPRVVQLSYKLFDQMNAEVSSNNFVFEQLERTLLPEVEEIYNKYPRTSRSLYHTGLQEFLEIFKTSKFLLVSHNVEYILNCIQSEIIRSGLKADVMGYSKYCTMIESIDLLRIPYRGSYKYPSLRELYEYLFNHSMPDTKHEAIKDVEIISKCFFKMNKRN